MLSANFGSNDVGRFNLSDPWWIKTIASRYAQVLLSGIVGSDNWNGTGECPLVTVARALKEANPKIKVNIYQAADRGSLHPVVTHALLHAHHAGS
jgi:hypothetical protein